MSPKPGAHVLSVRGTGWDMALDGLGPDGKPLSLRTDGALILQSDRAAEFSGSGFQPGSQVELYVADRAAAPRVSSPSTWLRRLGVRASAGTFVGMAEVDAQGAFRGSALLPVAVACGDQVLQVVGLSPSAQVRDLYLGVVVEPSLQLGAPLRTSVGRRDRIYTKGSSSGVAAGVSLTPYFKYADQSAYQRGRSTIAVASDGSFTWSRLISKDREVSAYVAYTDTHSNTVTFVRIR